MKNISFWGKFFLLTGCEAAIAIIVLFLIPTEQKSSSLLGFSTARLALVGSLLAIAGVCIGLAFTPLRWLEKKTVQSWLMIAAQMSSILGMGAALLPLIGEPPGFTAIHQRLLPFIVWFTVASLQLVLWSAAKKFAVPLRKAPGIMIKNWWLRFRQEVSLPEGEGVEFRWIAGVLLLAVLLPSVNYSLVNGLPVDNGFEILVIALGAPIAFSKQVSAWLAGWQQMLNKKIRAVNWFKKPLWALAILAVLLHAVLYFSASDMGFFGCYTTPLRASPRGDCEVFYQNPFQRYGVSRIDKTVDFSAESWNLSFLNDSEFKFYPWVPGNILRERFPFSASWTGILDLADPSRIAFEYVGEGSIELGGQTVELPPAYHVTGRAELEAPAGQNNIRINYQYDDGYRTGGDPPVTLLPAFSAELVSGEVLTPLGAKTAGGLWQFVSALADICILLIAGVFLCFYGWLFKDDWQILLLFSTVIIAIWRSGQADWMICLNVIVFLLFLQRRKTGQSLVVSWLFFATSLVWAWFYLPSFNAAFIRFAGTDMLTYEGFARSILHSGSLQAGEPIFYYQPFYRYLVFIYHLVFGDGDSLRSAFTFSLLLSGIWKIAEELTQNKWGYWKHLHKVLFIFTCTSVLLLINDRIMWLVVQGISETATWIFLTWGMWLMIRKDRQRHAGWIGLLLGLSLFTRINHLPAIIFMLLFYFLVTQAVKPAVIATIITTSIFLLSGLHNFVYGNQFILLPTSSNISANLILPPMEMLTGLGQISTWQIIASQSSLLLGIFDQEFWYLTVTLFVLVICWVVCAGLLLQKRNRLRWVHVVLLCLPWVFLGVQFFYVIPSMFPRHLMAGYLVMGFSIMICQSSLVPFTAAPEKTRKR